MSFFFIGRRRGEVTKARYLICKRRHHHIADGAIKSLDPAEGAFYVSVHKITNDHSTSENVVYSRYLRRFCFNLAVYSEPTYCTIVKLIYASRQFAMSQQIPGISVAKIESK